ncbi:DUF3951 domain-containing protein [Bacillus sp. FJAT-53711]|uniref:DUF3951 domain-containing protein n=1 Tax=Bacillus yunxiaonensis TaxID=3127665 RepID=A0ABU8FXD8_9BACI
MFILTIGVVMFTMFLFFIIGLTTYKMFVQKVTPQIYYTPFESITAQSPVEFHEEKDDREESADYGKDKDR